MLLVKKLNINAILPTVNHPGEDLGYDVYAIDSITLVPHIVTKVKTGIAVQFNKFNNINQEKYGLVVRDRSSMALKNIKTSAGIIDASYTGELVILMTNHNDTPYEVHTGDKIAQIMPQLVMTSAPVLVVEELPNNQRGENGFGSSGRK
jgi:dUTP pyrophosphatase